MHISPQQNHNDVKCDMDQKLSYFVLAACGVLMSSILSVFHSNILKLKLKLHVQTFKILFHSIL